MVSVQYSKRPRLLLPFALVLALAAPLAACGGRTSQPPVAAAPQSAPVGTDVGTSLMGEPNSAGFVIADEPTAVFAARSILEQGGSVGDAAAALYYTLAVTYPVAAGLGGGGLCLHYDGKGGGATSIDFLPREAHGGGALAVPGNVRGFTLIQARYGGLGPSAVMAPAERLAALGYTVSRALATALQANAVAVRRDPVLAALFVRPDGSLRGEGERITQAELAATLGLIGSKGPPAFYGGVLAQEMVSESAKNGGAIGVQDLYDYRARVAEAAVTPHGAGVLITPAERTGAGALLDKLLPEAASAQANGDDAALASRVRAALAAALARFGVGALPKSFGSAGFLVTDRDGAAIVCRLTMERPFGVAAARGLGFSFAPAPRKGPAGLAGAFLMPVLVASAAGGDVLFAGVGAGGRDGAVAVTTLALQAAGGTLTSLSDAMTGLAGPEGTINALACPRELGANTADCALGANPQAHGLAARGMPAEGGGKRFGIF